ncbi:MAG: type II secretion system minor pseudopilin GspK [Gammaproteobacteria bacterium]|nr:type II secretion system minor pseudopilin GspK [Gammaproteobacteria bacterium]MBU1506879.1 type II secretion system minor pseudopilin GspK [Gammaproteobacteria bacterium]MBU2121919.1 type II secretion system minor pseudopilin GspK [Gammaproteobacteria bacterium]MBU2172938.1 type II secretion system minor pseudopilin GspK [Gammaproteobacteria bacterium]MBU2198511.1 type II secretion system minor pseudopilin GspK [Gammaproteobacteria bacterium]
MKQSTPPWSRAQVGAALLMAMLTVTLVATFAASAMWQQWRAVEVETAERGQVQSAWILIGALDWSRLILSEDGRAGGPDHLAEPWAVPLEEARLSTFLAAEGNVSQVDDASTDTTDAFLSGQITDMQGRLNITNLAVAGQVQKDVQAQFARLFERLNLPAQELGMLVAAVSQAQVSTSSDSSSASLMPPTISQLGWLGLSPTTVSTLSPHVTILPAATLVNLNTADTDVLLAVIEGLDVASAQKIIQARETRHFRNLKDVRDILGEPNGVTESAHSVASYYFEVRGRLRLGDAIVDERSLVHRRGREVTTIWRERGAFDRETTQSVFQTQR